MGARRTKSMKWEDFKTYVSVVFFIFNRENTYEINYAKNSLSDPPRERQFLNISPQKINKINKIQKCNK